MYDNIDAATVLYLAKRYARERGYTKAEIDALLADKANTDGSYDLMTVGEAKALVGRGDGTAQQFVFRPTGGNASVGSGKARISRIKGNTVVFNQLVKNGNFATDSDWTGGTIADGKITVTAESGYVYIEQTPNSNPFIIGHKYFVAATIKFLTGLSASGVFLFRINYKSSIGNAFDFLYNKTYPADTKISCYGIFTAKSNHATGSGVYCLGYAEDNQHSAEISNVVLIDLTKMFGAGNEPSTAEEFEALYPDAYYEYNTGELVNVTATGIKTVGFNAYNPTTHTAELLGGKQYQITGAYTAVSYSTGETLTPDANGEFTPSANGTLTVIGYGADTCVHLVHSGYMDGEFEEHWDETKALPIATYFADGMKSVPSVYDELQGGKAIQRVGTRAYQSGDESDSSVVTDGTNTNYALATPVETAITTPLDLVYRVDDFGTEQEIATGASAPFKADIAYAMNAVDFIRNAPKNYISKESMDEFISALGTALNKTITATWNATTNRYNFTITDPQV